MKKNKLKGLLQRILQEIMKKKIILKHPTLGQLDNWPSDKAYYIEDCPILKELGKWIIMNT